MQAAVVLLPKVCRRNYSATACLGNPLVLLTNWTQVCFFGLTWETTNVSGYIHMRSFLPWVLMGYPCVDSRYSITGIQFG